MKGYLIDKNGALTLLPEFLSWDVCHGMGEPCDWFEVSFIYYSAQLPKLQSACRFRAVHNNAVVFKGIIDEYSISIDEKGSVVTLSGRSDAALLLDNELPAQEYAQLSNSAAVSAFARAFGISSVVSGSAKNAQFIQRAHRRERVERAKALLPLCVGNRAIFHEKRNACSQRSDRLDDNGGCVKGRSERVAVRRALRHNIGYKHSKPGDGRKLHRFKRELRGLRRQVPQGNDCSENDRRRRGKVHRRISDSRIKARQKMCKINAHKAVCLLSGRQGAAYGGKARRERNVHGHFLALLGRLPERRDDSDTGGVSMWLSEIKRKAEPTGTLPDISVNAAGDINLETAAARICIKNSGEIVIEGAVTVNGSAI